MVAQPQQDGAKTGAADAGRPALRELVPKLAEEVEYLLKKQGEVLLAKQVRQLLVAETCSHKHGTDLYTAPQPAGVWRPGHQTISLLAGHLVVDAVSDRIVLIEVLHRQFLKVV